MGFSIDQFISNITSSSAFSSVFNNPIFSALLIVVVILLIIYWVFSEPYNEAVEEADLEDSPSFWRLMFRSGIYMIIFIFGVLFVHYKYLSNEFETKHEEKLLKQTVQSAVSTVQGQGEPVYIAPSDGSIATANVGIPTPVSAPALEVQSGVFDTKPTIVKGY